MAQEYVHRQFKVNLIPTLEVERKSDGVKCIINESDFNDDEYTIKELERVAPEKKPAARRRGGKAEENADSG